VTAAELGERVYLLYVDESGDVGRKQGSSRYFALSGFVVHELKWNETLDCIIAFRRSVRLRYGLKLREEIHASHFIHKPGTLTRIDKSLRLRLLRDVIDFESTLQDISILNVIVDKNGKPANYDVFQNAWKVLIQRFENTLSHRNFPGPQNAQDFGVLVVDQTDEAKLRGLTRRMRVYNPVPNTAGAGYRQLPIRTLVEDAVHRDSLHSYFVQLSDVNAYFLYQKHEAAGYIKRKGARNYFDRLSPVLCTVASSADPQGIVRL
jgi:hypothetical protein